MASFIAQSMVYTSDTYNYCLGKEERALLRLREQKEQRMNLLGADKGQFQIQTFKVSFGQVQRKKAVENSDFIPLIENLPNPECMNAVRFQILMSPGEKAQQAIKEAGSGSLADEVERQGSFFLQNFNLRRPANCP